MAKRPCYGCEDDLDAIIDKRNAEIRAWGKNVLAEADAALALEVADNAHVSDWEQLDVTPDLEVVPETTQPEPELTLPEPDPAPSPEPTIEPLTETPKPTAKTKGAKPTT